MTDDIVIRPWTKDDIEAVYEIEKACFITPWSKESTTYEFKNVLAHYYVIQKNDSIIGFGGCWVLFDEAHITNIAIMKEERGNGYADRLLLYMLTDAYRLGARSVTLEVRENNSVAQNLYAKFDFVEEGRRKHYYEDTGEDAYILWNYDIEKTIHRFQANDGIH